jgi:AP-1 complex subunit gamma-1
MGSPPPQQQVAAAAHTAYNKNDLLITFTIQRSAQAVTVLARFKNQDSFGRFSAVNLQAAVPKTQKLQLQAISSVEIEGGQEAQQQMRVVSAAGGVSSQAPPPKLRLRIKLSYAKSGAAAVTEQVDWSEPT